MAEKREDDVIIAELDADKYKEIAVRLSINYVNTVHAVGTFWYSRFPHDEMVWKRTRSLLAFNSRFG